MNFLRTDKVLWFFSIGKKWRIACKENDQSDVQFQRNHYYLTDKIVEGKQKLIVDFSTFFLHPPWGVRKQVSALLNQKLEITFL